ncbi:MAG TPA: hypothetical protein VNB06_04245 [Thermoanaerobaculia bacterium]|nr:hypothetical protein [Thermoanaerobaculia bacterium]
MTAIGMSRWIAAIAVLGLVAAIGVSVQGYALPDDGSRPLVLHAGAGLVAFLLALLAQSWFAIFLAAGPWVARGIARDVPSERTELRSQFFVVALSGIAVATAMAAFVTGLFVYARDMGPFWHGTLALATVIFQGAAIVVGLRGVASMESQLRNLEQSAPGRHRA